MSSYSYSASCLGLPSRGVQRIFFVLILLVGVILAVPAASAQYDTATVVGVVTDPHGAAVPDVDVSLRNTDLGTVLTRKSNSKGEYEFPDVQIGTYTVSVTGPGFAESVTKPFDLVVSARQRMDIPLKLGNASESVTVSVDNAGLQTESGEKSTTIESEQIIDLPLNGREYGDLALLAPGVQIGSEETIAVDTYRRASFVTNANRSSVNNFLLDGLDNNSYEIGNEGFNNQLLTESVDAVQQLSVTTSNFSAEYGRDGGAIINVKSKSGTDKLHFTLYEFLRNTIFDAYGPFIGTGVKPSLIQNQFGGTVGGAIPKVKDFFYFIGYEGYRQATRTLSQSMLPTPAQLAGGPFMSPQLSTVGSPIVITPLENQLTGTKYQNGIIPLTDFTPFAAAVFAALPTPNVAGAANATTNGINFQENEPGHYFRDVFDIRLDKYFGNRLQTFARFAKQSSHITALPTIPGPAGGEGFGHMRIMTSSGVAGATYVLTPNSLIDLHIGVNFENAGKVPYNSGDPNFYSALGLPNPAPQLPMAGLNSQVVSHLVSFGMQNDQPQFNNPNTYNLKTNYTLAKGRHSYSFGFEWLLLNEKVEQGNPQYGEDQYGGKFSGCSGCSGIPANTTQRAIDYNLADFIFGARSELSLSTYNAPVEFYDFYYAYGQDSWKVSSRLTVQYGLRYEFATPERSRTPGQPIINFNPTAKSLQIGKPGSLYDQALVHPKLDNFAPRFGFAYTLYPNIVFRGGFGLSYLQWNRGYQDLLNNAPDTVDGNEMQTPSQGICPAGSPSLTCFHPTMQGYPSTINSPANFSTLDTTTQYKPNHLATGYVETYSLGTQVQVSPQTILNLAYVGVHDVHSEVLADYNEAAVNPVTPTTGTTGTSLGCNATSIAAGTESCLTIQARRPIPTFSDIQTVVPYGFLRYNSLQAQVTHQARGGFYLLNSFTWSKGIDNTSGTAENSNGDSAYIDLNQPNYDNGLSGYNQPLNDSLALVWKIPYGRSFNSRILRQTASGWTISTITRLTSGLPINVYYGPDTSVESTDLALAYRPNYTGFLSTIVNPRSQWTRGNDATTCVGVCNVLNASQIQTGIGPNPNGNMPRNALIGPSFVNIDLGLQKNFSLPHGGNFQFRTEAYNVMNHTNYKTPNGDISNANFGHITSAFASRILQFAVRLSY